MLGFLRSQLPTIKGCHHNHHSVPSQQEVHTDGWSYYSLRDGLSADSDGLFVKEGGLENLNRKLDAQDCPQELCRSNSVTRDLPKKSLGKEVPEIEPGWFVNRRVKKLGAGRSPHWAGHAPDQRLDPKRAHRSRSAQSHHRRHWPVRD